ncbi:MAG: hypothetical protein E4G90_00585 [Gemmatimonadales bacterium]|nr:MAG: hypothetical protein E4G90_00585 [Gemmatimonadales bacterium]
MTSWHLVLLRDVAGNTCSHASLAAENAALRHQLTVLLRERPRPPIRPADRSWSCPPRLALLSKGCEVSDGAPKHPPGTRRKEMPIPLGPSECPEELVGWGFRGVRGERPLPVAQRKILEGALVGLQKG